ncbi:MAG: alpha/beta fold hydrolase [Deltaproteobacteria bacterium]|nr:alpha/beta fold hydrolase [Deltaproteobacteria bacterium]
MPIADTGRLKIYYETHGRGDPVLMIMGLGATRHWWYKQVEALSRDFQVTVFDNRGVGETERPKAAWTLGDMALDTAALMDHLGIDSAHIVGASMGGMISQHFALEHPERVRKLVLACTTPAIGFKPPDPAASSLLTPRPGIGREQAARDSLKIMFVPEFIEQGGEEISRVMDISLKWMAPARSLMNQIAAVMQHDTRHRLKDVFHPTMVITGAADILIPPEHSDLLAELIPGARLVKIPNAGHGFFIEAAPEANQHLLEFLRD